MLERMLNQVESLVANFNNVFKSQAAKHKRKRFGDLHAVAEGLRNVEKPLQRVIYTISLEATNTGRMKKSRNVTREQGCIRGHDSP